MIAGNVPKHLVSTARTGFLLAAGESEQQFPWRRVAQEVTMDERNETLVDLGAAPMPLNSSSGVTVQDMIEITKAIDAEPWDITVWISHDAIMDDQTGMLETRVRQAGRNFQKHINKLVFQTLNGGDTTTYGQAYDGQDFFDSDHVDPGAAYQTNQDNEYALNLSIDNFQTVWQNAQLVRDDQGEFAEYNYDLLVIDPSNVETAAQIAQNREMGDTANRAINPWAGTIDYVVSPYLDTGAWHLIASNESIKPLLVAMREQPNLQHAWFDPEAPDGGRFYFKFYARYDVHYGQWRLAFQGQT